MDATLQQHVLDTEQVPAPERFGLWLDMIADSPAPLRVRTEHADDFVARAEFIELGRMRLIRYRYPSLDCVRTPKLIQRSDPDYYSLALTLTGTGVAGQEGQQSHCRPGEFTFYDCSLPHEVSHHGLDHGREHASSVVAFIPYDALPLSRSRLAPLFAGRMSGTEGIGALLADYLVQVSSHPEQYHAADAEPLADVGLDLISTMLGRYLVSEDAVPTEVRRRALLSQIHSHIRQHLGDPTLSPQLVADAHHISVRSLHRLFEAEETTVAAYIRDQRLERCRRDLTDPALRDLPIQVVAGRWGFRDKAHFSRTFRAAFAETPQAYRTHHLERARIVNTVASAVNS
ncbi:helix-turn-helix domain-containing protein [Micromonospora yasonensis]|uniref:helix-turn-helix domain-containing protein n=1 Tax=Micromonospora yasonensis TaxID=1128667 RepID=UPI00222F4586|nr:helix-turn-helix domain-containing protein [Micromonospora yasonensis]MCW3843426.1 helix-turn-helix domain-containing protein [Micromonospora yasonensis]